MANRPLLTSTLRGAALAGGVVLGVGLVLTATVEGPLRNQLGLALFMAFLAATVGALVGPLFSRERQGGKDGDQKVR